MAEPMTGTRALNDLVDANRSPLQRVVDQVTERVLNGADVRRVFGEPVTQGNRTVIPVAQVRTMFGFGAGSGAGPTKGATEQSSGEGGGAGGTIQVSPLGYIEITPSETRFEPTMDRTRIAITAIICATFMLILTLRRRK